jgi:replicative DNA helicase
MTDNSSEVAVRPEKLAPHSSEAEEAVLGSILINPDILDEVIAIVLPPDFYILRNGYIFEAILAVRERGEDIDNLTVIQELRDRGRLNDVGGSAYITYLLNNTPTHIHAETYANIVVRAAQRRLLLAAASGVARAALEENAEIEDVLDHAVQIIETATLRRSAAFLSSGYSLVDEALDQFLAWTGDPAEVRGLRSGIPKLDQLIGGFGAGRMYTLYGATGMGKSTMAAYIAINFMEQAPGLVVSTEMDGVFWIQRAVSDLSGIEYRRLESGHLTRQEKDTAGEIYQRLHRLRPNFTALRMSDPTPADIRANVRRLKRAGKCEWILIDSVNNIRVPGVNDIYPRTSIAADTALELAYDGLTVLVTSQTGRNAKARPNKMPQLNDAEGSGKVEQNSHMVIGIYRHDYYVERGEAKPSAAFPPGRTLLTVLKNRTGGSGRGIPVQFIPGRGFEYDTRISHSISVEDDDQ